METKALIGLVITTRDSANRLTLKLLKERGVEDIAPAYGGVFHSLFLEDELRLSEISKRINRDKSTVTALIKRLSKLGYVASRKDPSDSRATLIHLTNKGMSFKPILEEVSDILIDRTYAGFSEQEKEQLMELLGRVRNNLEG